MPRFTFMASVCMGGWRCRPKTYWVTSLLERRGMGLRLRPKCMFVLRVQRGPRCSPLLCSETIESFRGTERFAGLLCCANSAVR